MRRFDFVKITFWQRIFGTVTRDLRRNLPIDLVFNLEANDWNGTRTLQLRVRDMAFESNCTMGLELGRDGAALGRLP